MAHLLHRWRDAQPPWYILAGVVVAVALLPGGIPLTTALTPVYLRHRQRMLARTTAEALPAPQ
ncbi:MAG: hypothetical protein R3F39_18390 [Myxococcota bacterium]